MTLAVAPKEVAGHGLLQGKVVVELKISPSGSVVDCRIVSSELKASELEAKLQGVVPEPDGR